MRMSRRAFSQATAAGTPSREYAVYLWDVVLDTAAGLYGSYEPGTMVTIDVSQNGAMGIISSVEPYLFSISDTLEYELIGDNIARFVMPEFDVAVLVEFI